MTYTICKRCGTMFQKNSKIYCDSCFEQNNKGYHIIVDYIKQHPNVTVIDIIQETGVSLTTINCLVEEGDIYYVKAK